MSTNVGKNNRPDVYYPNLINEEDYIKCIRRVLDGVSYIEKTIGPNGRNILLTQFKNEMSSIVLNSKDGYRAFIDLNFYNRPMDIIHRIFKDAVVKINTEVGDSTSTTLSILKDLFFRVKDYCDKNDIPENIILQLIDSLFSEITQLSNDKFLIDKKHFENMTKDHKKKILKKIAMLSSNNDENISEKISNIFLDKKGKVFYNIELNNVNNEDNIEGQRGIEWSSGYCVKNMANSDDGLTAIYKEPRFLLIDGQIGDEPSDIQNLKNLVQSVCMDGEGTPLVIIADNFSNTALAFLTNLRNGVKVKLMDKNKNDVNAKETKEVTFIVPILGISMPYTESESSERIRDLSAVLGGEIITIKNNNLYFPNLDKDYLFNNVLGRAKKISCTLYGTHIKGLYTNINNKKIKDRIQYIDNELKKYRESDRDIVNVRSVVNTLEFRKTILASNMIGIYVGGDTFKEKEKRKLVYEDVVSSLSSVLINGYTVSGQRGLDYCIQELINTKKFDFIPKNVEKYIKNKNKDYHNLIIEFLNIIKSALGRGYRSALYNAKIISKEEFEDANCDCSFFKSDHFKNTKENTAIIYDIVENSYYNFNKEYCNDIDKLGINLLVPGNTDKVILKSIMLVLKIILNTFGIMTLTPEDSQQLHEHFKHNK